VSVQTNSITFSRCSLAEFTSKPQSRTAILRRIDALNFQIDQCLRFYPWPALIESFQRDIKALQALL
jgi:hypothetical protein